MLDLPIYLDHAATTPVAHDVLEIMLPYFGTSYGNSSTLYSLGAEARSAVETARESIADILNADPEEIVFTSGGTESDNWAIQSLAQSAGDKKHLLISAIEHHAVLEPAFALRKSGFDVELIPVDGEGFIKFDVLATQLRADTFLVSVMHANNEVGSIQDIALIASICQKHGVPFHVDAVQSFSKIPIDLRELPITLLAMSAHKLYGPKGVGALFVRRGTSISPYMLGGEQETGRRGGTLNVPGIVGFGAAAIRSRDKLKIEQERMRLLSNRLIDQVVDVDNGIHLSGSRSNRLASNVHVTVAGVEGESLLLALDMFGICASAGSACTTGSTKPSHVLLSMGMSMEQARGALRLTLGEETTEEAIDYVATTLKNVVQELRNLS